MIGAHVLGHVRAGAGGRDADRPDRADAGAGSRAARRRAPRRCGMQWVRRRAGDGGAAVRARHRLEHLVRRGDGAAGGPAASAVERGQAARVQRPDRRRCWAASAWRWSAATAWRPPAWARWLWVRRWWWCRRWRGSCGASSCRLRRRRPERQLRTRSPRASMATNVSIRRVWCCGTLGVLDPIQHGVAVPAVERLEEGAGLRPGVELAGPDRREPGQRSGRRTRRPTGRRRGRARPRAVLPAASGPARSAARPWPGSPSTTCCGRCAGRTAAPTNARRRSPSGRRSSRSRWRPRAPGG